MKNKIFCIGLPKTGTTSLAETLNYHGFKIKDNPIDKVTMTELQSGNYNLSILKKYDGISDLAACIYYKEYYQVSSESKFIYTTRNKNIWLESCRNWWEHLGIDSLEGFKKRDESLDYSMSFLKSSLFGTYLFSHTRFSSVYDYFDKGVRMFFEDKDNFLILPLEDSNEIKKKKLGNFLEKDIKVYFNSNVRGVNR
jgi:hypothetical protein